MTVVLRSGGEPLRNLLFEPVLRQHRRASWALIGGVISNSERATNKETKSGNKRLGQLAKDFKGGQFRRFSGEILHRAGEERLGKVET